MLYSALYNISIIALVIGLGLLVNYLMVRVEKSRLSKKKNDDNEMNNQNSSEDVNQGAKDANQDTKDGDDDHSIFTF